MGSDYHKNIVNDKNGAQKKSNDRNANRLIDGAVYDALFDVFFNGAYCAKALTDALKKLPDKRSHSFVTSSFYGVLDKNIRLEKIIACLCEKQPQPNSLTLLKLGLYYLSFSNIPDYAAVDRVVELSKSISGVYTAFINGTLKKSIGFIPSFGDAIEEFSYTHCAPIWLCKALISDYGEVKAGKILDGVIPSGTHIRPINSRITDERFYSTAKGTRTDYGVYCDKATVEKLPKGSYAVQSLSSIKAVQKYAADVKKGRVLDLCAAPGGKAIYLSELGDYDITACDVYPHKIELMKGYAKKCGAKINAALNDATILNESFIDGFDLVIADCPCSGTGTLKAKPDIMLRRKPSDIPPLVETQRKILDCASRYVSRGGELCYSTCSLLRCENEEVAKNFLTRHADYKLIEQTKLLPDEDGTDGFYIARFLHV